MTVRTGTFLRPGRLTRPNAVHLRARAVQLTRNTIMPWHSTQERQELLLVITGAVRLQLKHARRIRTISLPEGRYALMPPHTWHQVLNASPRLARYVYMTAPG